MHRMWFLAVTLLLLVMTDAGFAQFTGYYSRIWIKVSDDTGSGPYTIWYGNHINGTYGKILRLYS